MSNKIDPFLLIIASAAIGALAVYIFITQSSKPTITDITRDASGRIISIVTTHV